MNRTWHSVEGGVTAAAGFRAAGVAAGIKYKNRRDLALIVSDVPAAAAGVFTRNAVQAAPVRLCRQRLARRPSARAILVNSGNANACTGAAGRRDAERMAALAAGALGIPARDVLVCSTGTIGIPLPMPVIARAIPQAAHALSPAGGPEAAAAILTTDTRPKQIAVRFRAGPATVTLGGMAKGAGMIAPNMATLLVFLTTDAAVAPRALQTALAEAVDGSFNRITVDGDQSTNDTVLLLANGKAGGPMLRPGRSGWDAVRRALAHVTRELALAVVRDGEGATKFVTVATRGAATLADARAVSFAVANSLLVKTAWFGADPNWGRIMAAIGYSGAAVRPESVAIRFNGRPAVRRGRPAGATHAELRAEYLKSEIRIDIALGMGRASFEAYTCDCSDAYVRINASYMT
jgi:glutamate N-acetyltransferase/amino-acid N-acetyltransferase